MLHFLDIFMTVVHLERLANDASQWMQSFFSTHRIKESIDHHHRDLYVDL